MKIFCFIFLLKFILKSLIFKRCFHAKFILCGKNNYKNLSFFFDNEGFKKWKEQYIEKLKSRLSEEENKKANVDKI